ncbi:hypothetical protein MUP32_00360 [Candidatus Microgenomates bacterium]|nr:hypothetical protein [Candidatus Microgenomates bacterium]
MNKKKLLIIIAIGLVLLVILILVLSLKKATESPESQKFTNGYQPLEIKKPTVTNAFIDTFPEKAAEKEKEFQRINHPDVFLANLSPYKAENFSVKTGGFKNGHFSFTVILNKDGQALAKINFFDWLRSKGLDDAQTALLDIDYNYQ